MRTDTVAKQFSCKAYRAIIGMKGKCSITLGTLRTRCISLSVTKYYYLIGHDTINTNKKVVGHVLNTFAMTSFSIILMHNHLYGKLY